MVTSSRFSLGGHGKMVSSWFALEGSGGTVVFFRLVLGGSGGGVSLSSCCSSTFSDSLGSERMSSCENCCGGMGGGLPRGLWGLNVASSLVGREAGGVDTSYSK